MGRGAPVTRGGRVGSSRGGQVASAGGGRVASAGGGCVTAATCGPVVSAGGVELRLQPVAGSHLDRFDGADLWREVGV